MKFGIDTDKYGARFRKYQRTCQLFSFSSYATSKEVDDYITLHNVSMLLTFAVTLTLCTAATREVVNISLE